MQSRHDKWLEWLSEETHKPYFQAILEKAEQLNRTSLITPDRDKWFRTLLFEDIAKIHTIIICNRPYIYSYAADGLGLSCIDEADYEMGLLYRKLDRELGVIYNQEDNTKDRWLEQGVLILPIELTAFDGKRNDHSILWRPFTQAVLRYFIEDDQRRAFIFLDSHSPYMPALFVDKLERPHLYIQVDIHSPNFLRTPLFIPLNNFIAKYYSRNIDWR